MLNCSELLSDSTVQQYTGTIQQYKQQTVETVQKKDSLSASVSSAVDSLVHSRTALENDLYIFYSYQSSEYGILIVDLIVYSGAPEQIRRSLLRDNEVHESMFAYFAGKYYIPGFFCTFTIVFSSECLYA